MKKLNWPLLAVVSWFLAFATGVWADMPNPINISNALTFLGPSGFFCLLQKYTKKEK